METPEGWYPDPRNPEQYRWWNGTAWTEHTSPMFDVTPEPALEPEPAFEPEPIGWDDIPQAQPDGFDDFEPLTPSPEPVAEPFSAPVAAYNAEPVADPYDDDFEALQPSQPALRRVDSEPEEFVALQWDGMNSRRHNPADMEYLGNGPEADSPTRKRGLKRTVLTVAGAAALVVASGAAAFAFLSGGGPQPEQAMPADTIGFVKLDMNPSADQKINLARFITTNLPDNPNGTVGATGDPLGDALSEAGVLDGAPFTWQELDAWAGDRVALGFLPSTDSEPIPYVIIAVDDEQAMTTFMAAHASDTAHAMVKDGFAVVAETPETVTRVVNATSYLSDNPTYQEDRDLLGTGQILSGWVDGTLLNTASTTVGLSDTPDVTGRYAFAVTVEPDVLDLTVIANGATVDGTTPPALPSGNDLASAPANTLAGISIANPGTLLKTVWDTLPEEENPLAGAFGEDISVDDVVNALSSTVTVYATRKPGEEPTVTARILATPTVTEDAWVNLVDSAGATDIITVGSITAPSGTYITLTSTDTPPPALDGSTLADMPDYSKVVTGPAAFTAYINATAVWGYLKEQDSDTETYPSVTAVGMTAAADPDNPTVGRTSLRIAFIPAE